MKLGSNKPTRLSIVYRITFPNGKNYIGRTVKSLLKRKKEHYSSANRGSKLAVHRALLKYSGQEKWEVIHKNIEIDKISELEMLEIKNHNSTILGNGYNLTHGGEGVRMVSVSEETKRLQSIAKLGTKAPHRSEEWRKNIAISKTGIKNGMFGKKPSNIGKSCKEFMGTSGYLDFIISREKLSVRVLARDLNGNDCICFKSISAATEYFGYKSTTSISDAIQKGLIRKNHTFHIIEEINEHDWNR